MKAEKKTLYLCGNCGCEWDSDFEADDCCSETTEEKIMWMCGECQEEYETEHEANECCANQTLPNAYESQTRGNTT